MTLQVISQTTSQIERYKSTIDLGKQGAAKEPGDIAGDIRDNKSDLEVQVYNISRKARCSQGTR